MGNKIVGILGCGTMGAGIAQVSAQAEFKTWVKEVSDEFVELGKQKIAMNLDREIKKGNLSSSERDTVLSRIKWTTKLFDLVECSFIIEAVIEDINLKKNIFKELGNIIGAGIILASNTSSYSITELASVTRFPQRVVGLHFFYPVPMMKLAEIVKTDIASERTINESLKLASKLGKDPIVVQDSPGFVVNRLLVPYFLDSIRVLEEGLATVEDIDKGMTEGAGFVIGPFRLLDHVGLDTIYFIANSFYNEFREIRFAPPPRLKRMVMLGNLGRKSGKGFYTYKEGPVNSMRSLKWRWPVRKDTSY
ncbi:3-hydroxybutyryl-CoA dehydrogenase [bacterium]|nr:3-hydroxybutyryl-CoA dehydrogenase [bacterium]